MDEVVKIRPAKAADANLLAALGAATMYETYFETDDPHDMSKYIVDNFHPAAMKIELEDANNTFFFAEINGKVVGYAKLRMGQPVDAVKDKNALELHRLYVLEKMTRHGIGEILMRKCLEEARSKGFDALWLSVFDLNTRAQNFYKKLGFAQVGETDFFYGEKPFNCFVLLKNV
jgi:ribosomal protein S18 acetylase RimI-like enzyme